MVSIVNTEQVNAGWVSSTPLQLCSMGTTCRVKNKDKQQRVYLSKTK